MPDQDSCPEQKLSAICPFQILLNSQSNLASKFSLHTQGKVLHTVPTSYILQIYTTHPPWGCHMVEGNPRGPNLRVALMVAHWWGQQQLFPRHQGRSFSRPSFLVSLAADRLFPPAQLFRLQNLCSPARPTISHPKPLLLPQ